MTSPENLVTGGAGFIGSNVVRLLLEQGASVRVLDNLATGNRRNLEPYADRIDFIAGDIRDDATVVRAASGVRNVFHLAALPSVAGSVDDPVISNAVNAVGVLHLLVAARDAGAERFVFSSSSAIYGNAPGLPKRETMLPAPLSPYAVQKLNGEHYCHLFHELYGLETFALRYFNVYGPNQDPSSQYAAAIPHFIDRITRDEPPLIHGDGGQTRDFVFVDDVARANLACLDAPAASAGRTYNVSCGDRLSINDIAAMLIRVMGKDLDPVHVDPRPGDVRDSQGDRTAAADALGWEPATPFEDGIRKTVEYFRMLRGETTTADSTDGADG